MCINTQSISFFIGTHNSNDNSNDNRIPVQMNSAYESTEVNESQKDCLRGNGAKQLSVNVYEPISVQPDNIKWTNTGTYTNIEY